MLVVLGLNHKTAPVELREAFAVPASQLADVNRRVLAEGAAAEAMVLSTCNRVELYAVPSERGGDIGKALGRVIGGGGLGAAQLAEHGYLLRGDDAVRHLMRVCASLDSLVVGESQILAQVREALAVAREAGSIGPVLDKILQAAFRAAKDVRTHTAIAQSTVSIGSVAVELAQRIFPTLADTRVLVIGAGKMGQVTARALVNHGVTRVYVTSRSYERALALAETHGWRARDFGELDDLLAEVDVVITCTGSARPILDLARIRKVVKARKYRPLFLVDIAVPRDVDPHVSELDTVYLYNIDDLERISSDHLARRRDETAAAEQIVQEASNAIAAWHRTLRVTPTIAAIRHHASELAQVELERALAKRLAHLPEGDREAVQVMVNQVVGKLLHPAMTSLRESAESGEGVELAAAARRLFGVTPEDEQ